MINNLILVGTIANEIVVKKVGEFEVCNLILRVQRNFRDMDTNEYKCDFIPVTFWNVYAHNIGEYCSKGDTVGVKGRLVQKVNVIDGKNYYSLDVVGERIIFIHLKSYFEQFKDLQDKSEGVEDFGEPSLEELKRMANDVRYKPEDEDGFGENDENNNVKKTNKNKVNEKKEKVKK